jgi:plastocyanin
MRLPFVLMSLSLSLIAHSSFAKEHLVSIKDFQYGPGEITIKKGDTIKWVNQDDMPHTVTASSGKIESGNMDKGKEFSHIFDKSGNYEYTCTYHPGMTAKVKVTE